MTRRDLVVHHKSDVDVGRRVAARRSGSPALPRGSKKRRQVYQDEGNPAGEVVRRRDLGRQLPEHPDLVPTGHNEGAATAMERPGSRDGAVERSIGIARTERLERTGFETETAGQDLPDADGIGGVDVRPDRKHPELLPLQNAADKARLRPGTRVAPGTHQFAIFGRMAEDAADLEKAESAGLALGVETSGA
jgi:hypothetical protein